MFTALTNAYKSFTDDEPREYSQKVIEESKRRLQESFNQQRKLAKKQGLPYKEPDMAEYDRLLFIEVSKSFAEFKRQVEKIEVFVSTPSAGLIDVHRCANIKKRSAKASRICKQKRKSRRK